MRVLLLCVSLFALAFAYVSLMAATDKSITGAIGVVSPCGIYAIVSIRRDGSAVVYTPENPAPEDVQAAISALPEEKRHGILVPCPGVSLERPSITAENRREHDRI